MYACRLDETKTQNDLAKQTADSLEEAFKTQVRSFNKEADDCVKAIQNVIGN